MCASQTSQIDKNNMMVSLTPFLCFFFIFYFLQADAVDICQVAQQAHNVDSMLTRN